MEKREKWIDIAKGLLIVLVVIGHSTTFDKNTAIEYIYWVHMPAFFIISGILFKPVKTWVEFKKSTLKKIQHFIIPYLSFLLIFTIIRYSYEALNGNYSLIWYIKDFVVVLFGGRLVGGVYGVFWFVTTLLATQIIFSALIMVIKRTSLQILIIIFFYMIAHIESWLLHSNSILTSILKIPLNLDVALISLTYFAFGYYSKKHLLHLRKILIALAISLSMTFIVLSVMNKITYHLDLKVVYYNNFLLDIVIPILITISLLGLCQVFSKYKLTCTFSLLGRSSMIIMYLHIAVNSILSSVVSDYGNTIFTIVGVTVPVIFSKFLIERFKVTRKYLLGERIIPQTKYVPNNSQ